MEEEERRRVRRERNKVAALRCRVKRKSHVTKLVEVLLSLIASSRNNFLISSKIAYD